VIEASSSDVSQPREDEQTRSSSSAGVTAGAQWNVEQREDIVDHAVQRGDRWCDEASRDEEVPTRGEVLR